MKVRPSRTNGGRRVVGADTLGEPKKAAQLYSSSGFYSPGKEAFEGGLRDHHGKPRGGSILRHTYRRTATSTATINQKWGMEGGAASRLGASGGWGKTRIRGHKGRDRGLKVVFLS